MAGFIVGRIGRSLKKHTNKAQVKWGEILSQMEETLSGLRIIKAFNAQAYVNKKFDEQCKSPPTKFTEF